MVVNLQCFISIPALPSWCRFPGRCWHHTATADLGFVLLFLLLDCPAVLPHHTPLTQPCVVRLGNKIHLPGIPGLESEPELSVPSLCLHVCPLCSPPAQGMLEWLQHCSCEHPLALQETPAGDCWIFNPQS